MIRRSCVWIKRTSCRLWCELENCVSMRAQIWRQVQAARQREIQFGVCGGTNSINIKQPNCAATSSTGQSGSRTHNTCWLRARATGCARAKPQQMIRLRGFWLQTFGHGRAQRRAAAKSTESNSIALLQGGPHRHHLSLVAREQDSRARRRSAAHWPARRRRHCASCWSKCSRTKEPPRGRRKSCSCT